MEKKLIAVVGLGYVGLPLLECFSRSHPVVGFDVDRKRIDELRNGFDRTDEIASSVLAGRELSFTDDPESLREADVIIVTVPTPIDEHRRPDLTPLISASETVGTYLKEGAFVVYESTVYPGATEEVCIPILERESGMTWKEGFFVGYSPERINPGDKQHTVDKIQKVVAGDTPETAELLGDLYGSVIPAGIFVAATIKTAEAAKVIENCQRDINIAFVNELAMIFQKMGISTSEVLEAASTKWNFLPFRPGLVGGHCIGVDPYYLTHKAESLGYDPEVILSGRRINDGMGVFVASRVIKLLIGKGCRVRGARVLILGVTFKENCPDIRNSRVIDVIRELQEYGSNVDAWDPLADPEVVRSEYGFDLLTESEIGSGPKYDAVVHAVSHEQFKQIDVRSLVTESGVVYDVKSALPADLVDESL